MIGSWTRRWRGCSPERWTACDLLGVVSEMHDDLRAEAATAMVAWSPTETDGDVQWSIARALGATNDRRALPVLVAFAGHSDSDVRFQAAVSLPSVMPDGADDVGVAALIGLSRDDDQEVRNWATFGLGWQSDADTPDVRQALWERTSDSYDEAREEGIRGLARRRDQRALPLVAELLAADSAHVFTFGAAAFLGRPALLPLLEQFDAADPGVAQALQECDPVRRAHRDELVSTLFDAVQARLPDSDFAIYGERFKLGLHLEVTDRAGGRTAHWSVEGLLERAAGDPHLATDLVAANLMT